LVHKARTIEQDIHRPRSLGSGGNGGIIQHIQNRRADAGRCERCQQRRITIRCHHPRALSRHGKRGGAANALACCGDETKLACQSARHDVFPSLGRADIARFNPAP